MAKNDPLSRKMENPVLKLIDWWFASKILDLNCRCSLNLEAIIENKKATRRHGNREYARYFDVYCG